MRQEYGSAGFSLAERLLHRNKMEASKLKRSVLIVDDETEICILLAGIIRKKNVQADYVHSIADAKDTIRQWEPQLLFLDINLPDGNGIEFLAELNKKHPKMKVVVISAFDLLREKAYANGAFRFLPKPFSGKAVVDILERSEI